MGWVTIERASAVEGAGSGAVKGEVQKEVEVEVEVEEEVEVVDVKPAVDGEVGLQAGAGA